MRNQTPKYPNVTAELSGNDGNAYAVLGAVKEALLAANVPQAEVKVFMDEAMAGDYDVLLQTAMRWVVVA